jgi:hypothetical protein
MRDAGGTVVTRRGAARASGGSISGKMKRGAARPIQGRAGGPGAGRAV